VGTRWLHLCDVRAFKSQTFAGFRLPSVAVYFGLDPPVVRTILGGVAEFERSLIKARTDVGIKRAREAGIRFGRPPKLSKHQAEQALKLLDAGEPQSAVARLLAVDQSTISRLAARAI
jgi:DNA invertase Pin-like site-specific DNA recombinase